MKKRRLKRYIIVKRKEKCVDYSIVKALKKKLEGDIERSKCNINVYLNQSVGIGEHIDIVETVEKELTKLAEAEDKLETLINNFSTKDM